MKYLIFLLALAGQSPAQAQTARPFILAPGSSPQDYQQFLGKHADLISVTDYLAAVKPATDDKIFALADHLEDPADQLLAEIQNIHQELVQTEEGLLFIRDLLDKAAMKKLSPPQKKSWENLSCLNENLLNGVLPANCKSEKVLLAQMIRLFPWAEGILVEHRFVRLQKDGALILASGASYHFQILSNTHKTVNFYGTYAQLSQQSFQPETWVSGSCDEFSAHADDFAIRETSLVFFNDRCVQSLKNPVLKTSAQRWISENRNWLYAGGAFVLGAVVYGMRNKKMVIDTSGFN
jgi:hypothetical protein